ncbi:cholinesterase [Hortaea werneckii]|nr:cholinesterase [Hortaea werneckii]KAI7573205.1 cholinesterase [Hortaea werneckii]KAI7628625.1 cholinesterase [Hortaea werneckii]KAI7638425.1 cholinesterase [Hortaea werneckii]KAI7684157.1 cholinesterase [Hortaea werneckii]
MFFSRLWAFTVVPQLSLFACAALSCALTVQTSNGPIQGHLAENRSEVTEFLGIPFARPPGFDCPQGSRPPFDLSFLTPQAQQIIDFFSGNAGTQRDENCLTLNVWTKAIQNGHSCGGLPVLVFFYGGRTSIGTTNSPFYNGQYFSDAENVIVVTVNYRLNIFGFPGAPDNVDNLGFRDQRLAVEWVRDNIAAFGGDASRITIFGQSSGGVAVDYWAFAYTEDPIVSGLISHSGNALSFPMNYENVTLSNWYNVSAEMGCGSDGNTIPCMRTVHWKDIELAASKLPSARSSSPLRSVPPFYPKPDGVTVFPNYTELAKEGKFAKMPYLLGNNNNEQGYYMIPATAAGANVTEEEGDAFLLSSFTCPNMFQAEQRRAHGVPVWQYRYFGDWDNLHLYNGSGAYHGTDVQMLFANADIVSGIPSSDPENNMEKVMQHAGAVFAADPSEGLLKLGWPPYNSEDETLIRLAYENQPRAGFVYPSMYDNPCSTVEFGAYAT